MQLSVVISVKDKEFEIAEGTKKFLLEHFSDMIIGKIQFHFTDRPKKD